MLDSFNRNIDYLRISVTDRCNLRCIYCMPEKGVQLIKHEEILTYEEIMKVIDVAVNIGIKKVRITGGEPLIRKGIVGFIKMISKISELDEITMTTNGILLSDYANALVEAGLNRVNISLDTVNEERYSYITRGGELKRVIEGIIAIQKEGISEIKVNCVVENLSNDQNSIDVKVFCEQMGLKVRFIPKMNLAKGKFSVVEGGSGGDCNICNRLRLTANGKIKPCLFSDIEYDVRTLGAENALLMAINNKPETGTYNATDNFYNIGG